VYVSFVNYLPAVVEDWLRCVTNYVLLVLHWCE